MTLAIILLVGIVVGFLLVEIARRCRVDRRPGHLPPAGAPPQHPNCRHVFRPTFQTPSEWLVSFEIWGSDLRRAISLAAHSEAMAKVLANRPWEMHDELVRDVTVVTVQIRASNHDVALRIVEREIGRHKIVGLIARNLSARPGTIQRDRSTTA